MTDIGIDINFNKHMNHGIELRFFENITDTSKIFESLEFIIYLMDYSLENDYIQMFENPIINKEWNQIVLNSMIYGKEYNLSKAEKDVYEKIFGMKINKTTIQDIFDEIFLHLILKYNNLKETDNDDIFELTPVGKYSSLTIKPHVCTIKRIIKIDEPEEEKEKEEKEKEKYKRNACCCTIS